MWYSRPGCVLAGKNTLSYSIVPSAEEMFKKNTAGTAMPHSYQSDSGAILSVPGRNIS